MVVKTVEQQAEFLVKKLIEHTTVQIYWFPHDSIVQLLIVDSNKLLFPGFEMPVSYFRASDIPEDNLPFPYAIAKIHPKDSHLPFPDGWRGPICLFEKGYDLNWIEDNKCDQ